MHPNHFLCVRHRQTLETAEKQEEKCQVDIWLMESVSLESRDIKACEHAETDFFIDGRTSRSDI